VVSSLWWDNRRHCGITSRWVYKPSLDGLHFHLNNLCPRLETSSNQVRIVGFVDPWTIVCLRLNPATTPHPYIVSVCTLYYMTQMSITRLMSTYPWCQKVPTFASAQPLPIIRKELSGRFTPNANWCGPDPYSDSRNPNMVYRSLPPHLPLSSIPLKIAFLSIFSLLERDACTQCVWWLQRICIVLVVWVVCANMQL